MSTTIYLKLGKNASTFVDNQNKISISNKQVIAIDEKSINKNLSQKISSGHLEKATKEEFEAYQQTLPNGSKSTPTPSTGTQTQEPLGDDGKTGSKDGEEDKDTGNTGASDLDKEVYGDKTKSDLLEMLEDLEIPSEEAKDLKKKPLNDLIALHKKYAKKNNG